MPSRWRSTVSARGLSSSRGTRSSTGSNEASTCSSASSRYRDPLMPVQLSPILADLAQYPFARLDDWKADARSRGIDLIDFGMGDPREVTPAFIREAMLASVDEVSSYPRATGLPELREAIAAWIDRRFGVGVDPD